MLPRTKITRRRYWCIDAQHYDRGAVAAPLFNAGCHRFVNAELPCYQGNPHVTNHHVMHLVIQGNMKFQVDSKTLVARPGDLVYIPPACSLQRGGIGPLEHILIEFDDNSIWAPLKKIGPYKRKHESADLIYILTNRILAAQRTRDVYSQLAARECARTLVTFLKDELRQRLNPYACKNGSIIVAIPDRIRAEPAAQWNRKKIAAELNMSESTLIREFKRIFNMPPSQIVMNIRMESAAHMLMTTGRTVADIAYSVGYGSPYSFSRLFKKHLGLSPQQFRIKPDTATHSKG